MPCRSNRLEGNVSNYGVRNSILLVCQYIVYNGRSVLENYSFLPENTQSNWEVGVVVHAYSPSIWEAEAGRFTSLEPELHRD